MLKLSAAMLLSWKTQAPLHCPYYRINSATARISNNRQLIATPVFGLYLNNSLIWLGRLTKKSSYLSFFCARDSSRWEQTPYGRRRRQSIVSYPFLFRKSKPAWWNHQGPLINLGYSQIHYITVPDSAKSSWFLKLPHGSVCTWGYEPSWSAIRLCLETHINGAPSQDLQTLSWKQLFPMTVYIIPVLVSPEIAKK